MQRIPWLPVFFRSRLFHIQINRVDLGKFGTGASLHDAYKIISVITIGFTKGSICRDRRVTRTPITICLSPQSVGFVKRKRGHYFWFLYVGVKHYINISTLVLSSSFSFIMVYAVRPFTCPSQLNAFLMKQTYRLHFVENVPNGHKRHVYTIFKSCKIVPRFFMFYAICFSWLCVMCFL